VKQRPAMEHIHGSKNPWIHLDWYKKPAKIYKLRNPRKDRNFKLAEGRTMQKSFPYTGTKRREFSLWCEFNGDNKKTELTVWGLWCHNTRGLCAENICSYVVEVNLFGKIWLLVSIGRNRQIWVIEVWLYTKQINRLYN